MNIYIVEGRPSLSASFMVGLCLNDARCEAFECIETTNEKATWRAKRRGQPEKTYTFTIDDAKRAGLVDRGRDPSQNNWNKFAGAMLRARASSALARFVFPDIIAGIYSREEVEDDYSDSLETRNVEARIVETVVVQAPARDYDAEWSSLSEQIAAISSKADSDAARERAAAWDAPADYVAKAKEAYNSRMAFLRAAAKQGKPEPST